MRRKMYVILCGVLILSGLASCGKEGETVSETPTTETDQVEGTDTEDEKADSSEADEKKSEEDNQEEPEVDYVNLLIEALEIEGVSIEGMAFMEDGTDTINGQECHQFSMGENHEDHFVTLSHYAVGDYGQVYEMDIVSAEWEPFNTAAEVWSNWQADSAYVVFTDASTDEYLSFYDGTPEEDTLLVYMMSYASSLRVEEIEFDDDYIDVKNAAVVEEYESPSSGEVYDLYVPIAETIPKYRVVVEYYNGATATWYAAYDGRYENGIDYVTVDPVG